MPVFINTKFKGHYPVGTAAVVIASSAQQAADLLTLALVEQGLGPANVEDMEALIPRLGTVRILNNGNY